MEGYHFRKTGELVDLSPQNLINCTIIDYANEGCTEGEYIDQSFQYIKDNPGIATERDYSYEGKDAPCRFRSSSIGDNVTADLLIKFNENSQKLRLFYNNIPMLKYFELEILTGRRNLLLGLVSRMCYV